MPQSKLLKDDHWVLSGQDLMTGEVLYQTGAGWGPRLSAARVYDALPEAEIAVSEARKGDRFILFADRVPVRMNEDGTIAPRHYREGFRASGPSNRAHGKHAEFGEAHHV